MKNEPEPRHPQTRRPIVRRALSVAAGLSLVATCAVGCSSSGDTVASPSDSTTAGGSADGCTEATNGAVTVVTKQFDFNPDCITMTGDRLKVTYENLEDGVKHNFDIKDAKAASGESATELKAGPNTQTITFVDLKPGEYTYICDLHAAMKGTLNVKAS